MKNQTVQHTPGPWRVGYEAFRVQAGSMNICDIRGWGYLTGKGGLGLPEEEAKKIQEANAALIAAAPDGLAAAEEARAALYGCREVVGSIANVQHAIDMLEAFITKAKLP